MLLIIVPRHPERGGEVVSLARGAGFQDCVTLSRIRGGEHRDERRIVVIDVIGELFKAYSLATVVFCGGSLVPRGGQNILEPAAWGKVVLYGPSMEDFADERERLEKAGGGITVRDGAQLPDTQERRDGPRRRCLEQGGRRAIRRLDCGSARITSLTGHYPSARFRHSSHRWFTAAWRVLSCSMLIFLNRVCRST